MPCTTLTKRLSLALLLLADVSAPEDMTEEILLLLNLIDRD
jgi:hypothetical protein